MVVSSLTPRMAGLSRCQLARVPGPDVPQQIENDPPLFRFGLRIERRHVADLLELVALVNEQRGVTTVVHNQRWTAAVRPYQRLTGAPPVLGERLALPGEHGNPPRVRRCATPLRAPDRDRRRGMILRRKDVAGRPADVGAKRVQRLDEHGGLHRHVQTAHDPDTLERWLPLVFPAQRHQPRHLLLGEPDLIASERRQRQIRYFERFAARLGGLVEPVTLLNSRRSHSSPLCLSCPHPWPSPGWRGRNRNASGATCVIGPATGRAARLAHQPVGTGRPHPPSYSTLGIVPRSGRHEIEDAETVDERRRARTARASLRNRPVRFDAVTPRPSRDPVSGASERR